MNTLRALPARYSASCAAGRQQQGVSTAEQATYPAIDNQIAAFGVHHMVDQILMRLRRHLACMYG
jgi:hypothetical protein